MPNRLTAAVVVTLGACLLVPLPGSAGAHSAVEQSVPATIPALQQWSPAGGSFTLGAAPHIVVPTEDAAALASEASLLDQDLAELTGVDALVRTGGVPRPGDILLSLDPDATLGAEGYRMQVGDSLTVSAATTAGVFYGTRSILQVLGPGTPVPAGTATDQPRYPDRGVMIDSGRHFYQPAFYTRLIKRMAYLKLNLLHLHLTDDQGFAIESERHPEVVAPSHLTKAQVSDLVALAARHHITVVPELDMPGHMTAALATHPEWQLKNLLGMADAGRLDITNPAARAFVKDLVDEYVALFPGPYFHIGGDEYVMAAEYPLHPVLTMYAVRKYGLLGNGKDALQDFFNDMAGFLHTKGRVTRIWNDETGGAAVVDLDPRIIVEWWTDVNPLSDPLPPTPQQLVDRGLQVLNNGWWPTYFGSPGLPAPEMSEAYAKWRVNDFYGVVYLNSTVQLPPKRLAPAEPKNRGAKLAIWGDGPVRTDEQVAVDSLPHLRVVAQRTWESPDPGDYTRFTQIGAAIGPGPGQG